MPVQVRGSSVWVKRLSREDRAKQPPPMVQARDLAAAASGRSELSIQEPRAPKPKEMIEKIRIVGDDRLTARDQAIYELLLAWSRTDMLGKDSAEAMKDKDALYAEARSHEIPLKSVRSYAAFERADDLVTSLHRLSTTSVRYDIRDNEFRRRGAVPLVLAEVKESLVKGEAIVSFIIPPHVRRLMLEARSGSYGYLDLAFIARFRHRYTVRLYQRLALRAGYNEHLRRPWSIEPRKLAEELGYRWTGPFRYSVFKRDVLGPAMLEIAGFSPDAKVPPIDPPMKVWVDEEANKTTKGRGRRTVGNLVFHISLEKREVFARMQSIDLGDYNLKLLRIAREGAPDDIPSIVAVGRTLRAIGWQNIHGLIQAWKAVLEEARSGTSQEPAPGPEDIHGRELLAMLYRHGIDETFFEWSTATEKTRRYLKRKEPERPIRPEGQTREERVRDLAHEELEKLLVLLKGRSGEVPFSFNADALEAFCDPETLPWYWIAEQMAEGGRVLTSALRATSDLGLEQGRRTLYNLATAALKADFGRVTKVAGAVMARTNAAKAEAAVVRKALPPSFMRKADTPADDCPF
ncbi:replication initiation protein [Microvirga sp. GCM10011540]|uniref:replication initiation protein n=1 Tax=Microvirga sp. GCM10011540 TaxID=3317338 RepID=UPI003617ABA2